MTWRAVRTTHHCAAWIRTATIRSSHNSLNVFAGRPSEHRKTTFVCDSTFTESTHNSEVLILHLNYHTRRPRPKQVARFAALVTIRSLILARVAGANYLTIEHGQGTNVDMCKP